MKALLLKVSRPLALLGFLALALSFAAYLLATRMVSR